MKQEIVEEHPFNVFCPPSAHRLVLGSFPCFNGQDYGDWFYSGSGKNEFWKILSELFEHPAATRQEKESLCTKHGLAIGDIASKIRRKKGNCSDANLELIQINTKGVIRCLDQIKEIYFTSKWVAHQFSLHFSGFERLKQHTLLSPSPAANRYIGSLPGYKKLKPQGITTYQYRLLSYASAFKGGPVLS